MAAKGTFSFRLSAEGAQQVISDLKSVAGASAEAQRALDTLTRSSPQLATAADQASAALQKTAVALKATGDAGNSSSGAGGMASAFDRIAGAAQNAESPLARLGGAFLQGGVLGAGIAAGTMAFEKLAQGLGDLITAIPEAGDQFRAVSARLTAVTGDAGLAAQAYAQLDAAAHQTGISVNESSGMFVRLMTVTKDIGATTQQVSTLVRGIQEIGIVSGASTEEVDRAVYDLGHGLAQGELNGRPLRALMTQLPGLARALATELGVTIGQLREMGEAGKLSTDVVFPALVKAAEKADETFKDMPPTMSRAFGILGSSMNDFLVNLDQATGLSQGIINRLTAAAHAIQGLANTVSAGGATQAELLAKQKMDALQSQLTAMNQTIDEARSLPGGDTNGGIDILVRDRDQVQRALEAQQKVYDDEHARSEADKLSTQKINAGKATDALQLELDKRFKIQQDYETRIAQLGKSHDLGVIDDSKFANLTNLATQARDDELKKLDKAPKEAVGLGNAGYDDNEVASTVSRIQQKIADAGAKVEEELDGQGNSVVKLTAQIKALNEAENLWLSTQDREGGPLGLSPDRVSNLTQQAYANFYDQMAKIDDKGQETHDHFNQFFDRLADGFEDSILKGKKFSDTLKGLDEDLAHLLTHDLITEPLNKSLESLLGGGSGGGGHGGGGGGGGFGGIGGILGGGLGKLFGSLFGTQSQNIDFSINPGSGVSSTLTPAIGGFGFGQLGDITASANGNVMTGDGPLALPMRPFAKGGVMSARGGHAPAEHVMRALDKHVGALQHGKQHLIIAGHGVSGFADGGIMSAAGPGTLRRYAAGGIADTPQVALFGEGSTPEAYVPLPDGRSIPVSMQGGGGSSITIVHGGVTVNAGSSQASPEMLGAVVKMASDRANSEMLRQIERGGTVAKQVGRRQK